MSLSFVEPPSPIEAHRNVLLYGPAKTGKTGGACSAPGDIALLNADLPNASLFAHSRNDRIRELDMSRGVMQLMIDLVLGIEQQADGTTGHMFDTVVVDPIGDLHRRLLEEKSNRAIRPSLPQYGDVSVHIERFCRRMCELPVNFVVCCHDYPVKDESNGQIERLPWTGTTNPALGSKLMAMVDIIGYTGVIETSEGDPVYAAQLVSTQGRRGGERYSGVLGVWRALDLSEWFETIAAAQLAAA